MSTWKKLFKDYGRTIRTIGKSLQIVFPATTFVVLVGIDLSLEPAFFDPFKGT